MSGFEVLVDSDAWVGLSIKTDAHHKDCKKIFSKLSANNTKIVTTSYVVDETVTVLSHRSGQKTAVKFLELIRAFKVPIVEVDVGIRARAHKVFGEQSKKGISVTDCVNVVVAKKFGIGRIFSFDKFYFKGFGLERV